jgi:hypothetical protein
VYQIRETAPGGSLKPGLDSVGTVNGQTDGIIVDNTTLGSILVGAGQSGLDYDFGNINHTVDV